MSKVAEKTPVTSISKSKVLASETIKSSVRIKITTAWFTEGPCTKRHKVKLKELSIPGFPAVKDCVVGFHAEFALMAGSYLYNYADRKKLDCKVATIEVGFDSAEQTSYADLLKSDPETWKTAKAFHLGKAKKVLKKRVADLITDELIKKGVSEELVRDAQIEGFEALINLDPSALKCLFNSTDFPELEMVIAPIQPMPGYVFDRSGRTPAMVVAKTSAIKGHEFEDLFDHELAI